MTEEKMREVIKSEGEDSLLLIAIMKLIKMKIDEEFPTAIHWDQTDSARAFNNGRLASMVDLMGLIDEVRS